MWTVIIVEGLILIFSLTLLYVVLTELANFVMTRVPFVPTRKEDIEDIVKRVGINSEDFVYDLGSGNGKVLFHIERLSSARAMGLQRAGWTQTYAKLRARLTGSKVNFKSGNFFDSSWQPATVIYAYLYPFLMNQVGEKVLQDCRPGTKIIVRDFPISNLPLVESWKSPSNHKIYLYKI